MRRLSKIALAGVVAAPLALVGAGLVLSPSQAAEVPFPALPATGASTQSPAQVFRNVFRPGDGLRATTLTGNDDSFCVLSGVQGRQRGRSNVDLGKADTNWALTTNDFDGSDQEAKAPFAAGAVCVPRSAFVTDPGGVFEDSAPVQGETGWYWGYNCGGFNEDHRVQLKPATATAFVSALRGDLGSFADYVTIEVPSSATGTRAFHLANSQCHSNHGAAATSFFVGVPGQTTFPNLAPGYGTRTMRAVTNGSYVGQLARTRDGICGFTEFGGRWEGHLEGAWIETRVIDGVEWWVGRANAGSSGEVQAKVKCIAYDQRVRNESPDQFPS